MIIGRKLSSAALLAALIYGTPLPLNPAPTPVLHRGTSKRRNRRRGPTLHTMVAERLGLGRRRLVIATGPGSISAKSEFARHWKRWDLEAAYHLREEHKRQCGEDLADLKQYAVLVSWAREREAA